MGYHTKCTTCFGNAEWRNFDGTKCRRCNGAGSLAVPYRRALRRYEAESLGWNEMPSRPRNCDKKCCCSCNAPLPKHKHSFCCNFCQLQYLRRVWKAAHWQKRAVAIRDGAACRACGELHESPIVEGGKPYPIYSELELDHAKPLHLGGTEHPDNCQLLCVACHRKKTTRERFGTPVKESPK